MLLNNIEYNCVAIELANQVHQSECFDRTFCDLEEDLTNIVLLKQVRCIESDQELTQLNSLLKQITNKYYNVCNTCNKSNKLVSVIKDNTIEFYCKNPNCCPLSLQQIIANKIDFEFSIETVIKS